MDMTGIASTYTTAASGSAATAPKKELGKEEFLQLFTMQLKAQNPLKPMDSTEFTSQMAQFSSLEQLTNINTNLNNLLLFQNSLQNVSATGMIGKRVALANDEIHSVTGVKFDNNQTYLKLDNGKNIQLGDVREILGGI
jgi:flagellar basal-body rod modification protein FlgD